MTAAAFSGVRTSVLMTMSKWVGSANEAACDTITTEASHERLPTFRVRDERRIEFSPLGSLRMTSSST